MVRLKDIAARAGVTVMTVSKVMHDASDISTETKARIRLLADSMGYVPNAMARSLRNKTTKLIGMVVPSITHPVYARMISTVEQMAVEQDFDLILMQSLNLEEREEKVVRRLMSRNVDGLLIAPVYRLTPHAPIYDEIQRRSIKTIVLGPRASFCAQIPGVETDDVQAAKDLTQHLISLGHKRIAFFAGPTVSPTNLERLTGYRNALRDAGLDPDDRLVFMAGSTIEEGAHAAAQLMKDCPDATAIQAVSDLVAIGAGNYLLDKGVSVPGDLSLGGFGNILASEYFRVPLTTIRQPKMRLAVAAMEMLFALIKGEPVESRRLPAELVIRSSTAAAKPR